MNKLNSIHQSQSLCYNTEEEQKSLMETEVDE